MNLGLYGTLLDQDVRAIVLGKHWRAAGRPAQLRGWERLYVQGQVYPGIRAMETAEIDVLILSGVDAETLSRTDLFEGEEYTRQVLPVTFADKNAGGGQAMFYVPKPSIQLSSQAWRYDDVWRALHRVEFLGAAQAAMAGIRTVVQG